MGVLQQAGLRHPRLQQRAGLGQHVAPRRPPRLQLRHQVSARGAGRTAPCHAALGAVQGRCCSPLFPGATGSGRRPTRWGGRAQPARPPTAGSAPTTCASRDSNPTKWAGCRAAAVLHAPPAPPPPGDGGKRGLFITPRCFWPSDPPPCAALGVRQDIKPISALVLPPFLDTLWGHRLFQLLRAGGRWGQLVVAWGTWGERGWLSRPCCVGLGALPATPGLGRGRAVTSQTVPLG